MGIVRGREKRRERAGPKIATTVCAQILEAAAQRGFVLHHSWHPALGQKRIPSAWMEKGQPGILARAGLRSATTAGAQSLGAAVQKSCATLSLVCLALTSRM